MSDGAVPKITDFFALLSLQGGEVPVFSQLQCLLVLNDLTVTWPIFYLGHSLNSPHQKCRYPLTVSGFSPDALGEAYQDVSRFINTINDFC
jgi:hypothetical protein